MQDHLTAGDLREFHHGNLPSDGIAAVEHHLEECVTCCEALLALSADGFETRLREVCQPALPGFAEVRELGRGGMGVVYAATHNLMGRRVAVKVIHPEFARQPAAAERFRREVHAVARLTHPHIVTAHDAGQWDDRLFLVMEYIDGENLADLLQREGALPLVDACAAVRQAALGVQHAHDNGLVHRDLKPHNLMRTADGTVKVCDFGLAALVDGRDRSGTTTAPNAVMGTPDYMAPEQAEDARSADGRADVYSLGCTLFHLLTGHVPFTEESTLLKLLAHRTQPRPSPRQQRPEIPEELDAVVRKAMARDPAERYPSPGALAAALAPFANPSYVAPLRRWSRAVAIVGLFALVTMVAAAGVIRLPVGKDRDIVIETDDPELEVIARGDRIVRIVDPKTGKTYRLDRHDLTLSLIDDPDGLAVSLDGKSPVVLKRQGKRIGVVRLEARTAVDEKSMKRIFNGKDLTGWVVDGGKGGEWRVEDGELVAEGNGFPTSGYLLTEQSYTDFRLRFEYRMSEGVNTGFALRALPGERHAQWHAVPNHLEVQIADDDKYEGKHTGGLYWSCNYMNEQLAPDHKVQLKPRGSWNEMVIEHRSGVLKVCVNGREVQNADLNKLAQLSGAKAGLKRAFGRIGFQQHSREVRFRNITIEELPIPAGFLDPKNWHGLDQYWTIKDGAIRGATGPDKLEFNTFLCSRKKYRDFELRFYVKVWGKDWAGNSGVQIRSKLLDTDKYRCRGPQCDIGDGCWGSLYDEQGAGVIKQAFWEIGAPGTPTEQYNQYFIRCVGKHLRIDVNGRTKVEGEFPELPDEGVIGWQLHRGEPMNVVFRSIEFKELPPPEKPVEKLFNGKDLTGWQGLPGYWRAEDGAIVGECPSGRAAHTFLVSKKSYKDFDLKFEVRRKDGIGNSGVQFRSRLADPYKSTVVGPQIEIDSISFSTPPGSLTTEPNLKPFNVKAPRDAVATEYKDAGFNAYHIRCVGKHVTVKVNGVVAIDDDFTELPAEGVIAWQLHGWMTPRELTFRNIVFTDLSVGE